MTYVLRIRLPRDRSFIYARLEMAAGRLLLDVERIRRRYYSSRRVELMRFGGAR